MRIAVIGAGAFGANLAERLVAIGQQVTLSDVDEDRLRVVAARTGADAEPSPTAVADAAVVVLAVPFAATSALLDPELAAAAAGKVVVDVTNPLTPDRRSLTIGHDTSAGEQIAARLPGARVVKAFNTLLAAALLTPSIDGRRLVVPVAGDDQDAKRIVVDLAERLGFEPVDAGGLLAARHLEPHVLLLLHLARQTDGDRPLGLALARARPSSTGAAPRPA